MAQAEESSAKFNYIVDDKERGNIVGTFLFCVLCIIGIFVVDIINFTKGSLFPHSDNFLIVSSVLFLFAGIFDWSHLKHIKATIEWTPVSLILRDGKTERTILFCEGFYVTGMILCYGRRYGVVEKPFLVFWKPGQRPPKPHSWPIRLLRRSDCLFMPDTLDTRKRIAESFGLNVPEFPKVSYVPPNHMSDFIE